MAQGIELAEAYVSLIPTTRGITGNLEKELLRATQPAARAAGVQAGAELSGGIVKGIGGVSKAATTALGGLGKDIVSSMNIAGHLGAEVKNVSGLAKQISSSFRAGFADAGAAASAFTGKVGTLGGATRKSIDSTVQSVQNFRAGFQDAQAAASSFTGKIGTLGGVASRAYTTAAAPLQNFVSGLRDAGAATSSFTGRMGTVGGVVARAYAPALAPLHNFVAGFKDAGNSASTLSGRMSSLGGVAGVAYAKMAGSARGVLAGLKTQATAVTGLAGRFSGVAGAVGSLGARFGQFKATALPAIAQAHQGFQNLAGSVVSFGLKATATFGAVATGVGAIAVKGGVDRALAIENAQAKLKGLGHSTGEVQTIMQNALASVKGTSFGLGEAASTAAGAVAAGIKPGQQLQDVLKTVSNSAAIAGVDMNSMGSIFNKVAATGKLQGDELLQLSDAGVPALSFLSKETGKTSAEVSKMVSDGKISFDTFASAMKHGVGDAAFEMGKTTSGSFSNMKTAISRLGAEAVTPFMPLAKSFFGLITTGADALGKVAKPAFDGLGAGIARVGGALAQIGNSNVLTPAIVAKMGIGPSSALGRGLTSAIGGVRAFGAAWKAMDGDVTSTGFPGMMERAAFAIHGAGAALAGFVHSAPVTFFVGLAAAVAPLVARFVGLGLGAVKLTGPVGTLLARFTPLLGVLGSLGGALKFLGGPWGFLISLIISAVSSSDQLQSSMGGMLKTIGTGLAGLVTSLAPVVGQIVATLVPLGAQLMSVLVGVVQQLLVALMPVLTTVLDLIFGTLVPVLVQLVQALLPPLGMILGLVAQVIAAILPIVATLVTALVGLLVPVLQFLCTILAVVVQWLAGALTVALSWLTTTAFPALGVAVQAVGAFFVWLWQTVLVPAWQGIVAVISWAWTTIIQPIFAAIAWFITTVIAPAFTWLWNTILVPVWNGIVAVVSWAWNTIIKPIFDAIVWVVQTILAPVFTWLWNSVITPAFNAIVAIISWAWNTFIKVIFNAIRWYITLVVAPAFMWLWNSVIVPAWNGIVAVVSWAWNSIIKPLFNAISWFIGNIVAPAFSWLWHSIIVPVWQGIVAVISWAWNNIIKPLFGAISWFIGNVLAPVFTWLWHNVIQPVWDGIGRAINGAITWIRDSVLAPLGHWIQTTFVHAWEVTRDSIKKAWEGLQDAVKKPIHFVVDTVINGFVDGYNGLVKKWGGDKLDHLNIGFASGGYTGPGGKYTPAGIVHADEYVINKANRRKFERKYPGYLDSINATGDLPQTPQRTKESTSNGVYAGTVPPHGPGSISWGSMQAQASQSGKMVFRDTSLMGASVREAAKAWMGHSALDIRVGGGGTGVSSFVPGAAGGWGLYHGNTIEMNPGVPAGRRDGVLVHEIGHALGLGHTANYDSSSVMDHMMTGGDWPHGGDYQALQDVWGKPGKGAKTYANPGGGGDDGNWIVDLLRDKAKGVFDGLADKAKAQFKGNSFVTFPIGAGQKAVDSVIDWVASKFGGSSSGGGGETKTPTQWDSTIKAALGRAGLPTSSAYVKAWERQIQTESGGNPKAVQHGYVDVNTGGNEAAGLVQVIPPTFAAYRDKSLPNDRLNPLANLVAGMRYAKATYGIQGMLGRIGVGAGYAGGGLVKPLLYDGGGWLENQGHAQVIDHRSSKPDAVLTNQQFQDFHALAEQVRAGEAGNTYNIDWTVQERPERSPEHMIKRASQAFLSELEGAMV